MQDLVLREVTFTSKNDWIYGAVPKRLCYLRDQVQGNVDDSTFTAWQRLKAIHSYMPLVYSDMYRSPMGSAKAYEEKTGVQKPGYSGHNYGVSIDLAIDATTKRHRISYDTLVQTMIAFGWTPYQGVSNTGSYKRGKEDWHFNFVGDYGYRPWDPSSPAGGQQAIKWIEDNIKFETNVDAIERMRNQLGFGSLPAFIKSLPAKLQGHTGSNTSIIIRLLNIYTCEVLDTNGNIIPG